MSNEPNREKVLTVGAYDHDNFGDLLLLLVTQQYLTGHDMIAAGAISADMQGLLDRKIVGYGHLLVKQKFDGIWTVGGEIGGVDVETAQIASMSESEYRTFLQQTLDERRDILSEKRGYCPTRTAYIPPPAAYPLNEDVPTVINSAGISYVLREEALPSMREEAIALLRGTTLVSVRDQVSSNLLRLLEIEHTLAPDIVHALQFLRPKKDGNEPSNIAIVQANSADLSKLDIGTVASMLAESKELQGLSIRILLAGTGPLHDSREQAQNLVSAIRSMRPNVDAEVVSDRRPYEIVDRISNARIVIATSLHMRIVASAYNVPRVTFATTASWKVNRYAELWDNAMPFNVPLTRLERALRKAFRLADDPAVRSTSNNLASMADHNLKSIIRRFNAEIGSRDPMSRNRRIEIRRRAMDPGKSEAWLNYVALPKNYHGYGSLDQESVPELRRDSSGN